MIFEWVLSVNVSTARLFGRARVANNNSVLSADVRKPAATYRRHPHTAGVLCNGVKGIVYKYRGPS